VQQGILDKYNVELIGAKLPSIDKAEDRELFKQVGPATLHLDDNTDAHNTACCSCLDWANALQHVRPIIGCIGLCSDRLTAWNCTLTGYEEDWSEDAPVRHSIHHG
jgi:hypothetical protein